MPNVTRHTPTTKNYRVSHIIPLALHAIRIDHALGMQRMLRVLFLLHCFLIRQTGSLARMPFVTNCTYTHGQPAYKVEYSDTGGHAMLVVVLFDVLHGKVT